MITKKFTNTMAGLLLTCFSLPLIAQSLFSPYVDLTLNTRWDNNTQKMEPMNLLAPARSESIQSFHLAFITDSGLCQPSWGGFSTYSLSSQWGETEVSKLLSDGIEIIPSFGGASGTDLSNHCSSKELVSIFNQVLQLYHAKGLDFDIENGSANLPKLINALQEFQKYHPEIPLSFTLPTMPEGLTAEGKEVIYAAQQANLQFNVNIMAMDYGPQYSGDMGIYAIMAATALHEFLTQIYPDQDSNLLWKRIEVTPMIGVNDVSSEFFTLNNAIRLKTFADKISLGRLSMWSLTRDKPCPDKWASPNCSGNNLQTRDYEFVAQFR